MEFFNKEAGTFSTFTATDDSNVEYTGLNWRIENTSYTNLIRIYDKDEVGAVSVEELLLAVGFDFTTLEAENDGVFSKKINSEFSSACYPGSSDAWVRVYSKIIK